MKVVFDDDDLDRLETDTSFTAGHPEGIVKIYRKRIQLIRSAVDERDFYALTSLHYERLQGKRKHQRSMRLNSQLRLILGVRDSSEGKEIRVVKIEDYH